MKIVQGLLWLFLVPVTFASSPIKQVELTHENVRDFGFSVRFEVEPEATIITLVGPKSIKDCLPRNSGVGLLDSDGSEIMVSQSKLAHDGEMAPVSQSYFFSPGTQTLRVWIDYYCDDERDSRRYIVPSASDYLITSQGSKGASRRDRLTAAPA